MPNKTETYSRRCIVCGAMGTEHELLKAPLEFSTDGIDHKWPLCPGSGSCAYAGHQLMERLTFREIEQQQS